jgi:diaminopropionate ammonia-lyase
LAFPLLKNGLDANIAVEDERARGAMRELAAAGVVAGECGAAGLAGLMTWHDAFGGDFTGRRALAVVTEGATDPVAYRQIVERGS